MKPGDRTALVVLVCAILAIVGLLTWQFGVPSLSGSRRAFVKTAAPTSSGDPRSSNWEISRSNSPMGDGTLVSACTSSTNEITQHWPYHNTRATLCLRYKPDPSTKDYKRYAVIVHLDADGQIVCGVTDCPARLRLDDKPAESTFLVRPSDGTTNAVLSEPVMGFVEALEISLSKKAAFELTIYQAGTQVLLFNTAGLDWKSTFETAETAADARAKGTKATAKHSQHHASSREDEVRQRR